MVAPTSRRFSGGSWDLRKDERRKNQVTIPFADRRKGDRRFSFASLSENSQPTRSAADANLTRMR